MAGPELRQRGTGRARQGFFNYMDRRRTIIQDSIIGVVLHSIRDDLRVNSVHCLFTAAGWHSIVD